MSPLPSRAGARIVGDEQGGRGVKPGPHGEIEKGWNPVVDNLLLGTLVGASVKGALAAAAT